MRITLYRADIEAAVRSYICNRLRFAETSIVVTSGDGVIQVDVGENQSVQPEVGAKTVDLKSVTAVLQSLPSSPVAVGLSQNVTEPSIPQSPSEAAAASLAGLAGKPSPFKINKLDPVLIEEATDTARLASARIVDPVPVAVEEIVQVTEESNDNPEPVAEAEPARKVQSLFKNLKKPVNG